MMNILNFREFDQLYQQSLSEIFCFWTSQKQKEISVHNAAWSEKNFDFFDYLSDSSVRFYRAYRLIRSEKQYNTICDVGGFYGVFPLTMKKLGYSVTMTESLKYYSHTFDDIFNFLRENEIVILDYDPFDPSALNPKQFDVVTAMAVIEHYPHSLKYFLQNISSLVGSKGMAYLEVPNFLRISNRMNMLFGRSPIPDFIDIYESEIPFLGHHHEYTVSELRNILEIMGFQKISEHQYNYSFKGDVLRQMMKNPAYAVTSVLFAGARECISIAGRKS